MLDTIEKISQYASQAFERLKKENLAPIPENYELWYVYYSGANPDVTRAIDMLEKNGQDIDEERCHELHKQFLSDNNQSAEVRKAGDQIQTTIKGMTGMVSNVKNATETYNSSLSDMADKLDQDMSQDEVRAVVKNVADNTQQMINQNKALEQELARSSAAMEELRETLEAVRREAMTDGLTNLANRKAFDVEIEHMAQQADKEGKSFALLMMDIDHFKSFNDNFGHQVGDQVLRLVGKTLTDGVKGADLAARYGGEEFAILLPGTTLEAAHRVGDNLRNAVASKEVINRNTGDSLGRITLSGGVSQYIPGEKVEDLIGRADAALYTAKHNGRNQIASAPVPAEAKKQETGS